MPFDLSTLIKRFEHAPTELHQFEEKHQAVVAVLLETAGKLLETIPYGQEAEDVITALVAAGESAHQAIDKIENPGTIKVGGKIISSAPTADGSEATGNEGPVVDEAGAAAVADPPGTAAPATVPETTGMPPVPVAVPAPLAPLPASTPEPSPASTPDAAGPAGIDTETA